MKLQLTKKSIYKLVLTAVLVLTSITFNSTIHANTSKPIIDSLEIVGKRDVYYPGEIIKLKGSWSLSDDSLDKIYRSGDTFEVIIPEGLEAVLPTVSIGSMGDGIVVGNKIIFTFNQKVEQMINREGGFNLQLKVKTPENEGLIDVPLDFLDENSTSILKDSLTVSNVKQEPSGPSNEKFSKGVYPVSTERGMLWYIRANTSGEIQGTTMTLTDRSGSNHKIIRESLVISIAKYGDVNVGSEKFAGPVYFDEDGHGFSVDLDISEKQWYNVQYETEYTGSFEQGGSAQLSNHATLVSNVDGPIPMEGSHKDNTVIGDFDLGGWARGYNKRGSMQIKKIDATTKMPVANVSFKLTHQVYSSEVHTITSNADGIASISQMLDGVYLLEEISTPDTHIGIAPQMIKVLFNSDNTFEITVENQAKPISIQGTKAWVNNKGESFNPSLPIVIQLLADTVPVRQLRLEADQFTFEFTNLDKYNSQGTEITYTLSEDPLPNYTSSIKFNEDTGSFEVTNTEKLPMTPLEPSIPTTPMVPLTPAKPKEPTVPTLPVDPIVPVDPVIPVEPVVPVEPVTPVEPVVPVVPVIPVAPVVPVNPTLPTNPKEKPSPITPVVEDKPEVSTPDVIVANPVTIKETEALPNTGVSSSNFVLMGILSILLGSLFLVKKGQQSL